MIRILKLVTGEEIIGDSSEAHGEITVKKPCYIQIVPSRADPEQPAMALMPYAAYTKDHKLVIDISSYNNFNGASCHDPKLTRRRGATRRGQQ